MIAPVLTSNSEDTDKGKHMVNVTWINDGTQNGFWNIDPVKVHVNEKVAMVVYTLSSASTRGVRFDTDEPVLWNPPVPENFVVSLSDTADQIFIADHNDTQGEEEAFGFRLQAVFEGVARISHDPTIINVDPTI